MLRGNTQPLMSEGLRSRSDSVTRVRTARAIRPLGSREGFGNGKH